jgi:SagB-type dehydrogenase family enzyme
MISAGDFLLLSEPSPRAQELPFRPYEFAVKERRLLPVPEYQASAPCLEVLHQRESRRKFGTVADAQLSALLWFSAKTLRTRCEPSGFTWQHRPAPSGGGRHPIHILVVAPPLQPGAVSLYEPQGHALLALDIPDQTAIADFAQVIDFVLPPQQGTVLCFAAEPARTATRYNDSESLIWRDAGALVATIHIAAEALSLNCCALGPLFHFWMSRILPDTRFVGVGGVIVGAR